jgi:hypothetical protein
MERKRIPVDKAAATKRRRLVVAVLNDGVTSKRELQSVHRLLSTGTPKRSSALKKPSGARLGR